MALAVSTRTDEVKPDRDITPRAGKIDPKHLVAGRPPTVKMVWDRNACEAGAWRSVVAGQPLRIAPSRGLDVGAVLRDVTETLLSKDADDPGGGQ